MFPEVSALCEEEHTLSKCCLTAQVEFCKAFEAATNVASLEIFWAGHSETFEDVTWSLHITALGRFVD